VAIFEMIDTQGLLYNSLSLGVGAMGHSSIRLLASSLALCFVLLLDSIEFSLEFRESLLTSNAGSGTWIQPNQHMEIFGKSPSLSETESVAEFRLPRRTEAFVKSANTMKVIKALSAVVVRHFRGDEMTLL